MCASSEMGDVVFLLLRVYIAESSSEGITGQVVVHHTKSNRCT